MLCLSLFLCDEIFVNLEDESFQMFIPHLRNNFFDQPCGVAVDRVGKAVLTIQLMVKNTIDVKRHPTKPP